MKLHTAILIALTVGVMNPIYASDMKNAVEDRAEARHDAAKDMAEKNYDMAKDNCKKMSGNEEDVCMKDAKAAYVSAKAQAKANKKATINQADANDATNKARYKAAKERCDSLSGSAKDACVSEAKVKYMQ